MNNITGSLYRVNGKNHEKKCSQVKSVLSQRQFKTPCLQAAREDRSDGVSLTAGGRLFQARAAATENARSPSAKRLQWRHQDFHPGGRGTTNMFTKAGIHHRNVYMKKYDKLAHLITHKMAWSFQRQASVISIKTVNNTSSVNLLYNNPFMRHAT